MIFIININDINNHSHKITLIIVLVIED